ncbi:MAG: Trk family potassium uptake protein [Clostridia bacterium]|nr:Trk family potassium uptake protein [Clostridia bacterium]
MKIKLNALQFIVIGYLVTILTGSLLLSLPFAVKGGASPDFFSALFTATSATCVTGLIVADTYTHWSVFGQVVILLLIQIGGLGFMTVMTLIFLAFKKKIGVFERVVLLQSAGAFNLSGIIKLIKKIIIITFSCEAIGCVLLSFSFVPEFGFHEGLYFSLFHSVSAFCNAGFDLMGKIAPTSSFTTLYSDPLVTLTLCALIIVGGTGFLVWADIAENKLNLSKYQLHTKMVLASNFILIIIGTLVLFFTDYDGAFKDMGLGDKLLSAFFQAVSPRTAGFNTVDYASMSESGVLATIVLMFIGGNPGSTAGGVKTTTVLVVFLNLVASAKNHRAVKAFGRSVRSALVSQANALFLTYMTAVIVCTGLILALEPYGFKEVLFEVTSAVGTVGLSFGITAGLSVISKTILILLMFAGRIGAFSLFSVFFSNARSEKITLPEGKVLIG